ncbi:syndecan-4 [Esox lucius]|uniref:syndecan-4 n=1 Tax=Esox lucius TaxID=8010 RepID=UPI000577FD1E|nr:syndecan-4 [Esox lucius]
MRKVFFLVLFLFALVYSESVRETETWMPMKTTRAVSHEELISSGDSSDSPNGSDFAFLDEGRNSFDNEDDEDDEDYDDFSGSGDEDVTTFTIRNSKTIIKGGINDNKIPDIEGPLRAKPTVNINDLVKKNEVSLNGILKPEDTGSNVLMAHAGEESFFNKSEVLVALIAGGAVGLILAVLLILLLIYRMKKKDEGSYDLGKKPIYKKAPTTEIYA